MSYIINPYRYGAGDDPPGGDYVEISTSATVEEDMYDSDYKYFVIDSTTSSAFTVTDAGSASGSETIEVYLIAGGGGGGGVQHVSYIGTAGGGGAGGFIRNTSFNNGGSLDQAYNVTIGGAGTAGTTSVAAGDGDDSVLTPVTSGSAQTAVGGGKGSDYYASPSDAGDGGSGGGGGYTQEGGTGTTDQGNDGGGADGTGTPPWDGYNPYAGGGGAGGAGSNGADGGDGGEGWTDDEGWMDGNSRRRNLWLNLRVCCTVRSGRKFLMIVDFKGNSHTSYKQFPPLITANYPSQTY